jgi:RNA polymerase sigma-70 factor (ECF subfamily)
MRKVAGSPTGFFEKSVMSTSPSFSDLLEGLRSGQGEAAQELYRRYAARLVGLARGRLDGRLRSKVDPEDILQSVFRSFLVRFQSDRLDLDNWDSLWGLLVLLTLRKCGRKIEYFLAARRDVRRDTPAPAVDTESSVDLEVLAGEPSPEEAAALTETLEDVMRRLSSDLKRRIFELSLQGYSIAEISEQVGHYERGVERVRAEVRRLLEERLGQDAG